MVEASSANPSPEQNAAGTAEATFDFANHRFKTPEKTLVTVEHVEEFKNSTGCQELMGFIAALTNACKTTQMSRTPLTDVSVKIFAISSESSRAWTSRNWLSF